MELCSFALLTSPRDYLNRWHAYDLTACFDNDFQIHGADRIPTRSTSYQGASSITV
jgi:hypothetical protein